MNQHRWGISVSDGGSTGLLTTRLSAQAARCAEALRALPSARVPLRDLWRVLDETGSAAGTRCRHVLAGLIDELASAEVIRLPADRCYDHVGQPFLPLFVTVRPAEATSERDVRWHPELSWVPHDELTPSQVDRLEEVNTWLYQRGDDLVVPVRERSLEIFGHEKTLDNLLVTDLFAPGRLSLGTLRARRAVPSLHTRVVSEGDVLLVVENSDTFDSVARALARRPGRVGTVAWGAGAAFEASVLSVVDLAATVSEIRYFGDLDRSGLHVPIKASEMAAASRLPAVRPAVGLYSVLLRIGRPRSGQPRVAEPAAERLTAWLDPAHREPAMGLLTSGHRLAQEAVGLAHLLRHDDWLLG